jgi:hypothetical protein
MPACSAGKRKGVRMKNSIAAFAFVISLLLVASLQAKEDDARESLLKMKAGDCTFTLLDADGVKPMAGSTLSVLDSENGKAVVTMKADKDGSCPVKLVTGRYILNVDKHNLAVIDAVEDSGITQCRILVPDADMLVGGQDDLDDTGDGLRATLKKNMKAVVIGSVAVVTAGALIYENNKDDDPDGESSP